jgi:hypothetical protein
MIRQSRNIKKRPRKKKAVIYGVKTGGKYHYIGKTNTDKSSIDDKGGMCKSDCSRQYTSSEVRKLFLKNKEIDVVLLKTVPSEEWYDEKLDEVVEKYQEHHPLLNAVWMIEGKHGYWEDRKRDGHTLQRLSESKYKRIVEYDAFGNKVKTWNSGKEVAIKIFGDYEVVENSGSKSRLYRTIRSRTINGRFKHGSYWFREGELLNHFNLVPKKLHLAILRAEERRIRTERTRKLREEGILPGQSKQMRYPVVRYNPDGTVMKTYTNTSEAAYELKTSVSTIQRLCRGVVSNGNYILEYGVKTLQSLNIKFPPVEKVRLLKPVKPVVEHVRLKTRTSVRFTVVEYNCRGRIIRKFPDVEQASKFHGMPVSVVRRICGDDRRLASNNLSCDEAETVSRYIKHPRLDKKDHPDLRYGERVRNMIG